MIRINQYNLEPGVYQCQGIKVVVTDIANYQDNGELQEIDDPWVLYRDLDEKVTKHVRTMMRMSEFKTKFSKVP